MWQRKVRNSQYLHSWSAFAGFLAYIVGVSAVIGLGIVGLMALESSIQQTRSAPIVAATSAEKPLVPSVKQTNVHHKTARTDQTHKMAEVIHKQTREAPTIAGQETYGYAAEPRPYPNLFFFGR